MGIREGLFVGVVGAVGAVGAVGICGVVGVIACSGASRRSNGPAAASGGTAGAPGGAADPSFAPDPVEASSPPPRADRTVPRGDAGAFIAAHNAVRAKHCAPPVAWSDEVARVAQKWADHLRDGGCLFEHSQTQYGENLAAGTEGALDPSGVVDMWYGEISKYDFRRGGFSMETGHFTQVVWRATSMIGCGSSRCNGMQIWVCNYETAGNVEGEYRENVQPTSCR